MENNTQDEIVSEEVSQEEEILDETTAEDNVVDINEKLEENMKDKEIEELNEKYQRLQAEYSNYMRRTQQEKEEIGVFANQKIVQELIPVIDSMERAIESCTDKEDSLYEGINLVYKQLIDSLSKFGVEEIDSQDKPFDPNLHLAVMQENIDGVEPNTVVMVLQKGYKLGSRVIRPTMVKVSC